MTNPLTTSKFESKFYFPIKTAVLHLTVVKCLSLFEELVRL